MPVTQLLSSILPALILASVVALALKLRRWFWQTHGELATLRRQLAGLEQATSRLAAELSDARQEIVNTVCLAPLRLEFPVFLGGWSIDAFLGRFLVEHLGAQRPRCIVELGSGSSSILIARTLQLLGEHGVEHLAVDHEDKYLGLTRDLATLNGVGDRIEFLHCPLVAQEGVDTLWYEGLAGELAGRKIDLLLIDGPPGGQQPLARYPALRLLRPCLAAHCTVVLDDAIRGEERAIARRWAEENPDFSLTFRREGHGLAILRR